MLKILWGILGWKGIVSFLLFFTVSILGAYGWGHRAGVRSERDAFYTLQNEREAQIRAEVVASYEAQLRASQRHVQRLQERSSQSTNEIREFSDEVKANPTDPSCPIPPGRVQRYNDAVREANRGLSSGSDGAVR